MTGGIIIMPSILAVIVDKPRMATATTHERGLPFWAINKPKTAKRAYSHTLSRTAVAANTSLSWTKFTGELHSVQVVRNVVDENSLRQGRTRGVATVHDD